jgi:hypothetical protein
MHDQASLFDLDEHRKSVQLLEKIPFDFYYHYECLAHGKPVVYKHKLVDWEVGALYRRLRRERGASGWEALFREKPSALAQHVEHSKAHRLHTGLDRRLGHRREER